MFIDIQIYGFEYVRVLVCQSITRWKKEAKLKTYLWQNVVCHKTVLWNFGKKKKKIIKSFVRIENMLFLIVHV